jgi:hypothetical protein
MQTKGGNGTCLVGGGEGGKVGCFNLTLSVTSLGGGRERGAGEGGVG